jgi:hypothetical protein
MKFPVNKKLHSREALRRKLYSATAMLLVSAILMVSTSYAWYVMSTAPEVSGISTQVGANGALEVALLSTDSWNNLTLLDMGDFDESGTAENDVNLTWGNLVDLSSSDYGLDLITLLPARLYIEKSGSSTSGSDQYKINNVLLKTPIYGEDGRISGIDKTSAVSAIYSGTAFNISSNQAYGVRAIGTSASMSTFQLGLNAARSNLSTYTAAARTAASNALSQNGNKIANIVVMHALNSATETYTADDVQALLNMAEGLKTSLEYIDNGIRQLYVAYITSDKANISSSDYADVVAEINNSDTALDSLKTKYSDVVVPTASGSGSEMDIIQLLDKDMEIVNNAIDECTELMASDSISWGDISAAMSPLVDYNKMLFDGLPVEEVKNKKNTEEGMSELVALITSSGVVITVPTESGLFADIADYAGNYTANVTIDKVSYGSISMTNFPATMKTDTSVSPVYLTACSNTLKAFTVAEGDVSTSITDFYGYAIDLAFRTNAEDSSLLLQTEEENRVYDGSSENASLQGGGSYMQFTSGAGLSATKMVKLLSAIRVVFMDEGQNVLAIAALDTTLGKNVYSTELTAEEKEVDSTRYAKLIGGVEVQNSDYITQEEYEKLDATSAVQFDKELGRVTAKLYLYDFEMAVNSSGNETGGLKIGSKLSSAAITALTQDKTQIVTALVYMDGSIVDNSMVAANSAYSMTGTLNLQFSSSAELVPAEVTALRKNDDDNKDEEEEELNDGTETEPTGSTEQSGSGTGDTPSSDDQEENAQP